MFHVLIRAFAGAGAFSRPMHSAYARYACGVLCDDAMCCSMLLRVYPCVYCVLHVNIRVCTPCADVFLACFALTASRACLTMTLVSISSPPVPIFSRFHHYTM